MNLSVSTIPSAFSELLEYRLLQRELHTNINERIGELLFESKMGR